MTDAERKEALEKKIAGLPKVNNLAYRGLNFCCGMFEFGNFNYVDPEDGKHMSHFHQVNGWKSQPNAQPTTKAEIEEKIKHIGHSGVICSTGAGQEYLEPILEEVGFKRVYTFKNPGHAGTPVTVWCFSRNELPLGTTQHTMPGSK